MKNNTLFFVILLITACTRQDGIETITTNSNNDISTIRSYEEALKIAQDAIPILEKKSTTRGKSKSRKIDLNENKVFKLDAKTRTQTSNDTLIYVFNFENNEGFALVSASKNTEGLLAITEKGYCDPNTRSDIGGFELFLEMAKEYVAYSRSGGLIDYKDSLISTTYNYVGPYITVMWGQDCPEGEFCPNGAAGCTNTAMAQIMTYFQTPSSISLTYSGRDKSSQSLYWSAMTFHNSGHPVTVCSDTTIHKAIGRLHRQLGELNHSTYHTDGSGTGTQTQYYARSTFISLGYSCGNWSNYTGTSARNELNNAHLFLIRGETASGDGHAWAFDGYITKTEVYYEMINSGVGWTPTGDIRYVISNYNHFNWGWEGDNNGYFYEGIYDTSQGSIWDTSFHYMNYNYGTDIKLLSVYH